MKNFINDRRGNFTTIFAIAAVPLIGAVALTVDYAAAVNNRSYIQNAADAAILAGVRQAERAVVAGQSPENAERQGIQLANQFFSSQMQDEGIEYKGQFSADVEVSAGNYRGTAEFAGQSPTFFGKIFNAQSLDFNIEAAANIAGQEYNEIHIVIDNSASMGVGADNASIARMDGAIGCAFACHIPSGLPGYSDTHILARDAGAQLRIDVVKDAAFNLVTTIHNSNYGDLMNLAVHTFSNSLETVEASTSDIPTIKRALRSLELSNDINEGGTGFDRVIDELERVVGISGDGSTPNQRRKTVILITDGVATNIAYNTAAANVGVENPAFRAFAPVTNGAPGGWFTSQGFDDRMCRDLKDRNDVTVMTLNVEYVIPTVGTDGDTRFSDIERVLKPDIRRHMEDCASSPALAKTANYPDEINVALSELLQNLQAYNLRLTN